MGDAIKKQLTEIEEYCMKHGYEIERTYIDQGHSALAIDRPALKQLLADAGKANWKKVIVSGPERIARTIEYWKDVKDTLLSKGVELVTAIGTRVPLLLGVQDLFTEHERVTRSEKIKAGLQKRKPLSKKKNKKHE